MIGRVIEIAENNRYLSVYRGFMVVKQTGEGEQKEIGRIALDDIEALIVHAYGISYSNNLLTELAERGVPLVMCGMNHHPISMLLPFEGHHKQAVRLEAQIAASKPLKKQLWARIIESKLTQQAKVLAYLNIDATHLYTLAKHIKSGDSSNHEAQGARFYWKALLGKEFRRDQKHGDDINILLNFGYTVLRSSTARAIVAAGLHPTLGIFHHNDNNSMRLVDDLIEPFRPVVDFYVIELIKLQKTRLNTETKKILAKALYRDIQTDAGVSPVGQAIQRTTISLAQIYSGERKSLALPISPFIE